MLGIPVRYLLKHPVHGLIDIASDPVQVLMTMQDYYLERRERSRPRCQYQSDENWSGICTRVFPWPGRASRALNSGISGPW